VTSCVKWSGLVGRVIRGGIGRVVVAAPVLARGGGVGGGEEEERRGHNGGVGGGKEGRGRRGRHGEGWACTVLRELLSRPIYASRKACDRKWAAV
jgi:hypothetical protein